MPRFQTKTLIFWGYFAAVFLVGRINSFQLAWSFWQTSFLTLILLLLAAFLGANFLKIDQLIYVYFTRPELPLSLEVKQLIKQRNFKGAWQLLTARGIEQRELALKSVLFQVVWVGLALFTLTSTAGVFGKTLVMAIGLSLLVQEWEDILAKRGFSWLFWQIKRQVGLREQKYYLYLMTGLFVILTLLLI